MDEPKWLTARQERAWRGYRRMRTLLDLQLSRDLALEGLSETDYDVLSTLTEGDQPEWRVNALAHRLLWSSSRLSHHLRRMEKRGLVRRTESHDDARGSLVSLTDEGLALLVDVAPRHVASVREHFIDLLTPAQIAALEGIAAQVVSHLTEDD